jgi:hypothetical protein
VALVGVGDTAIIEDALSWDGGESCDCHHAFGDSVFYRKIHDDTQAASQTFFIDQGDC